MTPRYWTFVLLVLLTTSILGYGTFSTAQVLRTWKPDRNLLLIPAENVVKIGLIIFCLFLGVLSGLSFDTLGWRFPNLTKQLLIGTVWGIGIAAFFYLVTKWFFAQKNERVYSTVLIDAILPHSIGEAILVALAMILVVIVEELLFRSLLLGGLLPLMPAPILLVATGILFGILHSPQGWWGMIGSGAVGVLFGLLFLYYKSLGVPLVAHYVANMVQILLATRRYLQAEARLVDEEPVAG